MCLKLVFEPSLGQRERSICEAYWEYEYNGELFSYVQHIQQVCDNYGISYEYLFQVLSSCQAYLLNIKCEYCGQPTCLDVPADIPYMSQQNNWFCDVCICFSGGRVYIDK